MDLASYAVDICPAPPECMCEFEGVAHVRAYTQAEAHYIIDYNSLPGIGNQVSSTQHCKGSSVV